MFDANGLTELPFALPGHIFRSPMPFRREDPQGKVFQRYLENQIDVVVMLIQDHEFRWNGRRDLVEFYASHGLDILRCPIPDFGIPDWITLKDTLQAVKEKAQAGQNIVVHCYAGIGRTGTFMACLARQLLNLSGEEAIDWVRKHIPAALESSDQVQFVMEFEA